MLDTTQAASTLPNPTQASTIGFTGVTRGTNHPCTWSFERTNPPLPGIPQPIPPFGGGGGGVGGNGSRGGSGGGPLGQAGQQPGGGGGKTTGCHWQGTKDFKCA